MGPSGDLAFVERLRDRVFGAGAPGRLVGLQTAGGTGALRVGAELLRRAGIGAIHLGIPAWANHPPVMTSGGLEVRPQKIGTLAPGNDADITVSDLRAGNFPLLDSRRERRVGHQRIVPVATIKGGTVVYWEP